MSEPIVLTKAPVPEPDGSSGVTLAEVLSEIARLQELDEEWDMDGARRIDQEAIRLASHIVRAVAESARQQGVTWQPPEIGPVPDGSVALSWEGDRRQALMICRPGQTATVECVIHGEGSAPDQRVVPETEAVRLALWSLESV